jgi:uncharacterized membrane protein YgcG
MDFSRLRQGEIVAGLAGIALIVIMFLPWFGTGLEAPEVPEVPEIPGVDTGAFEQPEVDESTSGWDSLTDWDGFLIGLAGLSGIALAALAAFGRRINLGDLPRGGATAILGALATLTIVFRLIADPGDGLEYGIFLGLAAAIALTVGALLALREGGFEPLAAVAGGRTRAAGSTATTRRSAASGSRSSTSSRGSGSRSSGSRSSGSRSGSRSGGSRSKGSRSSK